MLPSVRQRSSRSRNVLPATAPAAPLTTPFIVPVVIGPSDSLQRQLGRVIPREHDLIERACGRERRGGRALEVVEPHPLEAVVVAVAERSAVAHEGIGPCPQ